MIACAVVQRIDSAYQAVSAPSGSIKGDGDRAAKADLVRFGEEDQGAIFCSCVPFFAKLATNLLTPYLAQT
mgnify:CR=1 FL=1